ncbi:MAG: DUF2238 domain-containing protein [Bacteroides sp.]|nr:DUF2238 domain-containing protein [Bacteroides sp.]
MSTTHVDKRLHIALLVFLLMLTALTTYQPIYPNEQFLQHIGTALLMGLIIADMRQHKLGITALTGLTLFTCLHIIGARWIYSYVPYASWAEHLHLPFELTTERNHYDRLVHFSFGLLLFPFFYDRIRALTHQRLWAISGAWLCIQTGSLVYELFEWGLTLVLSPNDAEGYNGQQGDIWDAQKDMALALVGSTLTAIVYSLCRRKRQRSLRRTEHN